MLHRAQQWPFLVALATLAVATLAPASHGATFDLIVADSIDATTNNSGFAVGNDIALIVNKRSTAISAAELASATFTATSSDPLVDVTVSITNTGAPVTPIQPNEAVGTLLPGSVLLGHVLPGETVRNVYPIEAFTLALGYPTGHTGLVLLQITMTMGGERADYWTLVNLEAGQEFSFTIFTAHRVSSVPVPTSARASTWGAIKTLYK